jgi:hypothetical protein
MKSRSFAMADAARRMCSSAMRSIALEDGAALLFGQHTSKRTRLSQAHGGVVRRTEQGEQLGFASNFAATAL